MDTVHFWWDSFWRDRVFIDLIVLVILGAIHAIAWAETGHGWPTDKDALGRSAQSLSGGVTGGLTVVGVLIPLTLVAVQIAHPAASALQEVFFADVWFALSMACGLYCLYMIAVRSSGQNVLNELDIGWTFGWQLLALLVGIARLIVGVAILFAAVQS